MILFRVICAVLMAWAINWVLSNPEANLLLEELPIMGIISPLAAALVGFFNLASRQGWGPIVAVANGVWAGLLSIIVAGMVFTLVVGIETVRGPVNTYESFVRVMESEISPLFELVVNFPLLTITITTTAILGVVTEFLHWVLVKIRKSKENTSSTA
jgi:hypothetical protein